VLPCRTTSLKVTSLSVLSAESPPRTSRRAVLWFRPEPTRICVISGCFTVGSAENDVGNIPECCRAGIHRAKSRPCRLSRQNQRRSNVASRRVQSCFRAKPNLRYPEVLQCRLSRKRCRERPIVVTCRTTSRKVPSLSVLSTESPALKRCLSSSRVSESSQSERALSWAPSCRLGRK
jgi:hypothetical protein